MYCAAYAMTQPEQRICIFSPSRRQSKMLLDQIKKFISEYEGGTERIKKFNQEELWIEGDDPDDVRVICSYPSKVSIGVVVVGFVFHGSLFPPPPPTHTKKHKRGC